MTCYYDDLEPLPWWHRLCGWILIAILGLAAVTGCTEKPKLPPQAAPAVPVYVPVQQPCEVEKVPLSPLPTAHGVPNDIFGAVQRILADRAILLADREQLVAANTDPCPEIVK